MIQLPIKNDVLNWRGGADSFDGGNDGGDFYNGGSDWVVLSIETSTSMLTQDTSVQGLMQISSDNNTLTTIVKNQDGSFDVTSGNIGTLHLVNTEVFRLYITPQNGESPFNFDVD